MIDFTRSLACLVAFVFLNTESAEVTIALLLGLSVVVSVLGAQVFVAIESMLARILRRSRSGAGVNANRHMACRPIEQKILYMKLLDKVNMLYLLKQ